MTEKEKLAKLLARFWNKVDNAELASCIEDMFLWIPQRRQIELLKHLYDNATYNPKRNIHDETLFTEDIPEAKKYLERGGE